MLQNRPYVHDWHQKPESKRTTTSSGSHMECSVSCSAQLRGEAEVTNLILVFACLKFPMPKVSQDLPGPVAEFMMLTCRALFFWGGGGLTCSLRNCHNIARPKNKQIMALDPSLGHENPDGIGGGGALASLLDFPIQLATACSGTGIVVTALRDCGMRMSL